MIVIAQLVTTKLMEHQVVKLVTQHVKNVLIMKLAKVAILIITYMKSLVQTLVQTDITPTHLPIPVTHVTQPVPLVLEQQTTTVSLVLLDYS